MKRTSIYSAVLAVAFSLSVAGSFGQTAPKKKTPAPVAKKAPATKPAAKGATPADIAEGKGLLSKSDCLACHKVDARLVGPGYNEVAKKYPATEANYSLLAKKIISGGSGVWGQIPMAPHPAISEADAQKMVKYILSIK